MKKIIFGIVIGIILGSGIVYAASYYAKDVTYEPTDASWEVSNVEDALNSLYSMKSTNTNYENILNEYTITPSNSNASGSNIEPVNIGEDNFYNLTGSVNYSQNVSFSINKDLSNYKFLKLYIEYNGRSYNNNVELTVGNDTPLSFNIVPNNSDTFTKVLIVGINELTSNVIKIKITAGANVPKCLNFNIGISLGK